jgi:hypothetical protein
MRELPEDRGEVVLYRMDDGTTALDVRLAGETVWLTLNQMAQLFGRDKSVILRCLRNIYDSRELSRRATVAKNITVQFEGGRDVTRNIECYNLYGRMVECIGPYENDDIERHKKLVNAIAPLSQQKRLAVGATQEGCYR